MFSRTGHVPCGHPPLLSWELSSLSRPHLWRLHRCLHYPGGGNSQLRKYTRSNWLNSNCSMFIHIQKCLPSVASNSCSRNLTTLFFWILMIMCREWTQRMKYTDSPKYINKDTAWQRRKRHVRHVHTFDKVSVSKSVPLKQKLIQGWQLSQEIL